MKAPTLPSRYQVRSLLGEGGAGRVYRVHDSIRDRELALKLVTAAESGWLRREFDILRQIRHENLVQVFDWGALPSGEAYYTMELIEGGDWARLRGQQPADEVRRILTSVLRGLAHLHCHGEIHGDLKPGNILLGLGGTVKITDVGMLGSEAPAAGSSATPGYAAPEVWSGSKADVRSDLYSVGVMAYETLTGRHPFEGRTVRDVVSGQLEGWVPSPRAHGVHVPPDLEREVLRAVERQPGLRQSSADEFMEGIGVEDRVGEILGGRLVGRESEISGILTLLASEDPGAPTLIRLVGEPGIGKAALSEEVCDRVATLGLRVLSVEHAGPDGWSTEFTKNLGLPLSVSAAGDSAWISKVAEALCTGPAHNGCLISVRASAQGQDVDLTALPLARYVWAVSQERNKRFKILFVIAGHEDQTPLGPFERRIFLRPLDPEQVAEAIRGVLGSSSLEPALVAKLHALSGGNPGHLRAALIGLIDQRLIDRRDGSWRFREVQQIQSLRIPETANPWLVSWEHLTGNEKKALMALCFMRLGLPIDGIGIPGLDGGPALFAILASKGWIRADAGRWRIASEGIRQAVLQSAPPETRGEIAKALLLAPGLVTGREERADLVLKYDPSAVGLEDVLWAAEKAAGRGDHRTAASRLRAISEIVGQAGRSDLTPLVSLRLATALHQMGDQEAALDTLTPLSAQTSGPVPRTLEPQIANLLGEIHLSLGRLDLAREHFHRSARIAEETRDSETSLRSQAALAELDWRNGNETERDGAIAQMRTMLAHSGDHPEDGEIIGNLTYQIGAGLIIGGRYAEAEEILSDGLAHQIPDPWRMRLMNARASSGFYLGDFDRALGWVTEAWEIAERNGFDSFKARILANRGGVFNGLGRPRDALDQHLLSARWARRAGDTDEYAFACSGASFNLTLLARYEEALRQAGECRRAREGLKDVRGIAKAMELGALALFYVGDYAAAESLVEQARALISNQGFVGVGPRLDWLGARLASLSGDKSRAEELLASAEGVLAATQDWEDLPGVQIEKQVLYSGLGDPRECLTRIWSIAHDPRSSRATAVGIGGGVAIAQILLDRGEDHAKFSGFISSCLERAEVAGMVESSWYLSYALGEFAERDADLRSAQTRFGHAIRTLREISEALSADHRKLYLARPHTRSAISRMSRES